MTTFSALNLPVTSTGQKEVLAGLEQIDKKVGVIQVSASKMAEALKKTNGDLQAAARMVAAEEEKAAAAIDQVTVAAQRAGAAAKQSVGEAATSIELMEVRSARATQGIARGLEMVARTGKLTGRSLDAVLSNVSGLALGFGTGGVLIGAIGIATASIVELFMRTRRELEKTQQEFSQRMQEMAEASNLQALAGRYGSATKLYSGSDVMRAIGRQGFPKLSDIDYIAQSGGIVGLQAERDRLQARVNANPSMFRQGSEDADKLRDVMKKLTEQQKEYNIASMLTVKVMKTVTEQEDQAIQNAAAKKKPFTASFPAPYEIPGLPGLSALRGLAPSLTGDANRTMQQKYDDQLGTIAYEGRVAKEAGDMERYNQKLREYAALLKEIDESHPENDPLNVKVKADKMPGLTEAKRVSDEYNREVGQMTNRIASTASNALVAGFSAAFAKGGGLKSGLKALTGSIISGLGDMFISIGEKALAGMTLIKSIAASMATWNPAIGIPAAIGLIALGSAMKGAASGSSGGGGGSGYSGSSYASSGLGSTIFVNPAAPENYPSSSGIDAKPTNITNVTVIGKDDPSVQRQMLELMDRANRRGSTGG